MRASAPSQMRCAFQGSRLQIRLQIRWLTCSFVGVYATPSPADPPVNFIAAISRDLDWLYWLTWSCQRARLGAFSKTCRLMGYFKYKERGFYLQQTADAIESEWEALEAGVGRYKESNEDNEEEMLALFSDKIHRLKSEQKQRQQSLDQPESSGTKD